MFIANFDFQSFHDGPGARLKILDTSLFSLGFSWEKIPGPKILGFSVFRPSQDGGSAGVTDGRSRSNSRLRLLVFFPHLIRIGFHATESPGIHTERQRYSHHGSMTKKIPHIEHVFSAGVGRVFVMQGKQAGSCPLTLSHQACFVSSLGSVHVAMGWGKDIRVRENLSTSIGFLEGGYGDCAFALMEKESGFTSSIMAAMQ